MTVESRAPLSAVEAAPQEGAAEGAVEAKAAIMGGTPSGRSGGRRSSAIDVLRGLAVLSVMLHHLPFSSMGLGHSVGGFTVFPSPAFARGVEWGKYGVHLFLVISGFCIHMPWASAASDQQPSFLQFWKRRLARLYPPYIVVVLGCLALMAVGWRLTGSLAAFGYGLDQSLLLDVLLLLLLAQNLNGASHRIGDGPLWSLALEEQLYLLYFPLLWMRKHWGWARTLTVVTGVTLLWRWVFLRLGASDLLTVGPALWLVWAFGAFAVEVHTGRIPCSDRWRSYPLTAVVLGIAAALIHTGTLWGVALGVALLGPGFFLLIIRATVTEAPKSRWLALVGRALSSVGVASYSLYLVHDVGYKVAKQAALTLGAGPALALVARVLVGVLGALLVYRLVELPAHRWARTFKLTVPTRRAAEPAQASPKAAWSPPAAETRDSASP